MIPMQVHQCKSGLIAVRVDPLRAACQKGRPVRVLLIELERRRIQAWQARQGHAQ